MIKKGIILAGGLGSRMSPLTKAVNKQLLPLYDKPLIYYPLSILMLANIKNILIIVNKGQLSQFKKILPEKNNFGIKIEYKEQIKPRGLPEAFLIGKKFIYATIFFVESFVEKHYDEQILKLRKKKNSLKLIQLLETLKNDEISHKEDSLKRFDKLNFLLKIWGNIVEIGSRTAVLISHKI